MDTEADSRERTGASSSYRRSRSPAKQPTPGGAHRREDKDTKSAPVARRRIPVDSKARPQQPGVPPPTTAYLRQRRSRSRRRSREEERAGGRRGEVRDDTGAPPVEELAKRAREQTREAPKVPRRLPPELASSKGDSAREALKPKLAARPKSAAASSSTGGSRRPPDPRQTDSKPEEPPRALQEAAEKDPSLSTLMAADLGACGEQPRVADLAKVVGSGGDEDSDGNVEDNKPLFVEVGTRLQALV